MEKKEEIRKTGRQKENDGQEEGGRKGEERRHVREGRQKEARGEEKGGRRETGR